MAESSLFSVFQETANEETAQKWLRRLVWAELTVDDVKLWWPALRFETVAEFDRENELEAAGNFEYRIDLALCLIDKMNSADGPVQVVRFLGRPLSDVQPVHGNEVLDFIGHLNKFPMFRPHDFATELGFDRAGPLFEDFHRGMDDVGKILYRFRPRPSNLEPWASRAKRVWTEFLASQPQQRLLPQGPPAPEAHFPPQPPSLRQALSPNHSVAAVSVADDSVAPVNRHHRVAARFPSDNLDYQKFPKMDPLGLITWKEARVQITCAGWTKLKNAAMETYQPYPKGPHLTLEQTKNVCQQIYGWTPLAEDGAHTPLPPRMPTRHHEPPASNAKNYSFGFLWKHKCVPDGWTRIKPPKGACDYVDYYYLRPGFTRQNLGKKNQDHFDDHYGVLDWCRRNNYYPSNDWNTADDTSVATEVADDPSSYLDQVQPPQDQPSKGNKSKKKGTPRNYSFGVLWASHLEPSGWTMPKAKRNPLTDYYYVRPGCTVEGGELNVDYFATTDAVLEYCAKHQDYPESSGASTCSHDDRTLGTSTMANEETSDDESTKTPAETEDEANKPVIEDDDNTLGEFSTPGTKTQPQDPGKPLLCDDDETPQQDEEEAYYWKNLWPVLKHRGWKCEPAKNQFDDWWYLRPRKLELDEVERDGVERKMVKGVDYFTTEQEVIDYCKEIDREDSRIGRLKSSQDDNRKQETSDQSHHKVPQNKSKDAKSSQQKKSKPKPQIKKNRMRKPRTASDICAMIEINKNKNAPWVSSPLPKNLHHIVTTVAGINYKGTYYYLHNESHQQYSHRFQNVAELLKYLASHGRWTYFLNQEAKTELIREYKRLIAYAFVPGSSFEHRRIRPLTRNEIILCLKEIFQFTFADEKWQPPQFLRSNGALKASYDSLPELLRALRGVEHLLEGDSKGHRRKPLDKKSLTEQRDHVIMAFRLSIAEDTVIDGLQKIAESGGNDVKPNEKKKIEKTTKEGTSADGSDSSKAKNKKRGSPDSASKKGSKRLKPDGKFEIEDLKVKWKGDPQTNRTPWPSIDDRDFARAKLIGVSYHNGHYYLPNESGIKYTARFTSIDQVFTHLCTYGNYSVQGIDEDTKHKLKGYIAMGNVPGVASTWKDYRLLKSGEALAILGLLGFQELPDKSWLVPDILLKEKNPFRKGNPSLINAKYASLDELRVALRSLPDLETTSDDRRRRRESKLNEHQTIAFRLWLATGPEGPDDTRMDDNAQDESNPSQSNDEPQAGGTIESMTLDTTQIVDSWQDHNAPGDDQPENGDICSPEITPQPKEQNEMKGLDDPDALGRESDNTEIALVMESQDTPSIVDCKTSCGSDFTSRDNPTSVWLPTAHDTFEIPQTEPQRGSYDSEMADGESEPKNETVPQVRVLVNPLKPENAAVHGGLVSTSLLNGDTEMTDADFDLSHSTNENVCPNILDVCTGNTGRELLTQPGVDSFMSQESDDDENATFINYGSFDVLASPTSPDKTQEAEDTRKVYSVEHGGAWDRNQGTWLTQGYDH